MGGMILAGLFAAAAVVLFTIRTIGGLNRTLLTLGGMVLLLLALFISIANMVHVVPVGHRGVVSVFGQLHEQPLMEGLSFVNPLADVEDMDVRIRKDEEVQTAETSNTQTVTINLLLNWHPDPTRIVDLFHKAGLDYDKRLIPIATQEVLKAEVAKYPVADLIIKRNEIKAAVERELAKWLSDDGIITDAVAIGNVDFSDAYDKAIEQKQVAEQRALQAENELTQARTEASKAKAIAGGIADAAIEQARGEAESLRLRGAAQSDYNHKVSESLTPMLVQMEWMKTWRGTLPQTLMLDGGKSATFLLPLSGTPTESP